MLPSISQFENAVSKLGITEKDHVIVYDANGVNAGVRVYWTFKVFGHKQISVLDGGLPKWLREGRPVEAGIVEKNPTQYKVAKFHSQLVKDYRQIVENIGKSKSDPSFVPVVDARPHARFTGEAPEPRAGITSGHMPNSISIPFTSVVDGQSNTLLPKEKLQELFQSKGLDLNKPIITSCGSGVTASIVLLALEEAGAKNVALYDGSWAEYASKAGSTIVKGDD
ncbi:Rhodanese-like domain-containing protein [Paraphysoderma sedebokerense]|nr:Rhodanese-like domain-containing protein [Paraphysoderma sedebokerense]